MEYIISTIYTYWWLIVQLWEIEKNIYTVVQIRVSINYCTSEYDSFFLIYKWLSFSMTILKISYKSLVTQEARYTITVDCGFDIEHKRKSKPRLVRFKWTSLETKRIIFFNTVSCFHLIIRFYKSSHMSQLNTEFKFNMSKKPPIS